MQDHRQWFWFRWLVQVGLTIYARVKHYNRLPIVLALAIGLLAALVTLVIAPLHVYKAKSGYSGQEYWLTFPHRPTEDEFLDAIIFRDPLISNPSLTIQNWRNARREHTRLFIKKDNNTSILVMPFDPEEDPDIVFPAETRLLTDEEVLGTQGAPNSPGTKLLSDEEFLGMPARGHDVPVDYDPFVSSPVPAKPAPTPTMPPPPKGFVLDTHAPAAPAADPLDEILANPPPAAKPKWQDAPVVGTQAPTAPEAKPKETPNGGRIVKGVWLTEPATRTEYSVVGVGLVFALGSFMVAAIVTICAFAFARPVCVVASVCWSYAVASVRWLWHHLSSDFLLLAVGILLVGAAVAVAVWTVFRWNSSYRHGGLSAESVAAYGFVCAVIGLSGLVCAVLGLARLLARRKGT